MKLRIFITVIAMIIGSRDVLADIDLILDLSGSWRFRTGDHITWRNVGYNDERWDSITVPATWESQGYAHDGYAWYRKTFTIPEEYIGKPLILVAGKIDDIDQTFLNGKLIGAMGAFPPTPESERDTIRMYEIPEELLMEENVIAIRVFNMGGDGGIYTGPIGIARQADR